ncbi:MAG: hypothetical protein LBP22_01615 [Deltaproteobacteria bacterium]|jgi:hypothetical protein|nr:hypothetical protein [Deltaproteobacteria bacterium]
MIIKKLCFLGLVMAAFFALSRNAEAQFLDYKLIDPKILAREGPLTQKDVDLLILFLNKTVEAHKAADQSLGLSQDDRRKLATQFLKDNDFTYVRLNYVIAKVLHIVSGFDMAGTGSEAGPEPDYLVPSQTETALIKSNIDKLSAAFSLVNSAFK